MEQFTSPEVNIQPQGTTPQIPKKKQPHTFFSILIGLAIAILFTLLYFYSYQQIVPTPKVDISSYNKEQQICNEIDQKQIYVKDQCLIQDGVWHDSLDGKSSGSVLVDGKEVQITGRCDMREKYQECIQKISPQNPYSYTNSNSYENNIYLGALVFGIILLVISMFIRGVLAVSVGLSLAGVFLLVSGIFHFWADISGLSRIAILSVGLAVIIYLAIKKLKSE
jgi:hypothetical protein